MSYGLALTYAVELAARLLGPSSCKLIYFSVSWFLAEGVTSRGFLESRPWWSCIILLYDSRDYTVQCLTVYIQTSDVRRLTTIGMSLPDI